MPSAFGIGTLRCQSWYTPRCDWLPHQRPLGLQLYDYGGITTGADRRRRPGRRTPSHSRHGGHPNTVSPPARSMTDSEMDAQLSNAETQIPSESGPRTLGVVPGLLSAFRFHEDGTADSLP